jgi:hypothetical protein
MNADWLGKPWQRGRHQLNPHLPARRHVRSGVPADGAGSQVCEEPSIGLGTRSSLTASANSRAYRYFRPEWAADEAMDLLLAGARSVERLVLQPPERRELALTLDHCSAPSAVSDRMNSSSRSVTQT